MARNEYRERYESLRKRHRSLRDFVENSRHADREKVVSVLDNQTAILDSLEELLEKYELAVDLTDDHDEQLTYLEGSAEALDGFTSSELVEAVEAQRTESRELDAMIEEVEEQLDRKLDRIETNVTELGKTLATTDVYDPTSEAEDDIDPAEKADLDDILRGVSHEGDDWYDD